MTSVIAVHGVGNRTRERFVEESSRLSAALAEYQAPLHLAFWGHLAPSRAERYAAVPVDEDDAILPVAQGFIEPSVESSAEVAARHQLDRATDDFDPERVAQIRRATSAAVAAHTATSPPPEVEAIVTQVLDDAVARGRHLALEPEIAEALAQTIVSTQPAGDGFVDQDLLQPLRRSLGAIVDAVDSTAARAVGRSVQWVLRETQAGLSPVVSTTVADILLYENEGARVRGVLDAEYERARQDDGPVSLAAHSLGALIAVEWLLGAPVVRPDGASATATEHRELATLVTFGAQVALFSEIRGLRPGEEMPATSVPVSLPVRLDRWFNVWHQLDPLAFTVGRVLQLGNRPEPGPAVDLRLDLASVPTSAADLSFHSSYWKDDRFLGWAAPVLAGEES